MGTLLQTAEDEGEDDDGEADDGADHGPDLGVCEAIMIAVDVGVGGKVVGGGSVCCFGRGEAYCRSGCEGGHDGSLALTCRRGRWTLVFDFLI